MLSPDNRLRQAQTLLTGEGQGQLSTWAIERAMRKTRSEVEGLPAGFRYHDQRHNCC